MPSQSLLLACMVALVVQVSSLLRNPLAGRILTIVSDTPTLESVLLDRVEEIALDNINRRGSFTLCIGSGSTVKPLSALSSSSIDFSKVHIFFGNDRTEGDKAGKCLEGATDFVTTCGIPPENVHGIPKGMAPEAAEAYVSLITSLPVTTMSAPCKRSELPSYDLVILGTGADGHCASLYPDSPQVLHSVDEEERMVGVLVPGKSMYVESAGKGGVTITVDGIQSAKQVILCAAKADQAEMVKTALGDLNAINNINCPAGMIMPSQDDFTKVEWLLTMDSAKLLNLD